MTCAIRGSSSPALTVIGDFLIEFEVGGGAAYYNRFLLRPSQPTPSSGVTVGIGYDLGQATRVQFLADWRERMPDRDRVRLCAAIGLTHHRAAELLPQLETIVIPWADALAVFCGRTLVRLDAECRRFYAGVDGLPAGCQAAVYSVIYNRGSGTVGESRLEMREMQAALREGLWDHVPVLLRSMKRLWIGRPGGAGLIRRREAEAALFERSMTSPQGVIG